MNTLTVIEPTTPANRDLVRKELDVLASSRRGLTPKTVLEVAKHPKSSLHRYFLWDDTEAAQRYREFQAYQLIRSITVTIERPDKKLVTVRAFVNVKPVAADGTINNGDRGHFIPVADALEDEDSRQQVLAAATRELAAFRRKYSTLNELSEVCSAIEDLLGDAA